MIVFQGKCDSCVNCIIHSIGGRLERKSVIGSIGNNKCEHEHKTEGK